AAKRLGSRAAKTRRKVAWEGMPLVRARKRLSQSCLARPKASRSGQDSAPPATAHRAMTRMSPRECSLVRSMRGSGRSAKWSLRASWDAVMADPPGVLAGLGPGPEHVHYTGLPQGLGIQ